MRGLSFVLFKAEWRGMWVCSFKGDHQIVAVTNVVIDRHNKPDNSGKTDWFGTVNLAVLDTHSVEILWIIVHPG